MNALAALAPTIRALDLSSSSPSSSSAAASVWSMAHVLEHCAQSIEYSLAGFPRMKPAPVRFVARFVMRGFLKPFAMSHDLMAAIPGAPALSSTDAASARDRLLTAIDAFSQSTSIKPHFAYGRVGASDYARLHAMHIEDHLRAFAR